MASPEDVLRGDAPVVNEDYWERLGQEVGYVQARFQLDTALAWAVVVGTYIAECVAALVPDEEDPEEEKSPWEPEA